jgi:hypothetical protein
MAGSRSPAARRALLVAGRGCDAGLLDLAAGALGALRQPAAG